VMIALVVFAVTQLAIIVGAWIFCAPSIAPAKARVELEPQPA